MDNEKNTVKEDSSEETDFDSSEDELEESDRAVTQKILMLENDLEDELEESEHAVIQRMLMSENDLEDESEESECTVMQRMLMIEMDLIFNSDDEDNSPSISTVIVKRSMCELCYRFYYSEYKRVRVRCARLSIDKTPGQHLDCDDDINIPLLRECCIQYYSKWL
jgi:hypothetical protein